MVRDHRHRADPRRHSMASNAGSTT
jgi:hypothetical protein